MTDKEKAIIMAYTGICMLTGDKLQIFHEYIEDIMGRPIMTHEIGLFADTIKKKARADFIALCKNESNSENSNGWISVSKKLPKSDGRYIVTENSGRVCTYVFHKEGNSEEYWKRCALAWMESVEGILDKIRAEIEQAADKQFQIAMGVSDLNERYAHLQMENAYRHSLSVIDKYKTESEEV